MIFWDVTSWLLVKGVHTHRTELRCFRSGMDHTCDTQSSEELKHDMKINLQLGQKPLHRTWTDKPLL